MKRAQKSNANAATHTGFILAGSCRRRRFRGYPQGSRLEEQTPTGSSATYGDVSADPEADGPGPPAREQDTAAADTRMPEVAANFYITPRPVDLPQLRERRADPSLP